MRHTIETPAGAVTLECSVEAAGDVRELAPRDLRNGLVRTWRSELLDVTLVAAHIPPLLSEHWLPLDDFVGAVWTLDARGTCGPTTVTATLHHAGDASDAGADCGQKLCALTYERDGLTLSIGTHDVEALHERAADPRHAWGPPLPRSWARDLPLPYEGPDPLTWDLDPAYGDAVSGPSLLVRVPPLRAGEHADLHVAVGWGPTRDDAASWYAVDTEPRRILREALGDD